MTDVLIVQSIEDRCVTSQEVGRERRRSRGGRALGRVMVHDEVGAAAPVWDELEAICPSSAYQRRRWLEAWSDTIGRACGVEPMLISAYDRCKRPVAFLPLGIVQHGHLCIAGFLGGRHSNANLGLFRPGAVFSRRDLESMFRAAATKAKARPDAFVLANQPDCWEGERNPLSLLPSQPSPSAGHATRLSRDFTTYVAGKMSSDSRKKLMKKRKRLEKDFGAVRHVVAEDRAQAQAILDAFLLQKNERLRAMGVESEFDDPATRAFLERAIDGAGVDGPAVELHGLIAGQRIVATYAGARHRGRFHAMINSYDAEESVARCSPGDLLLMSMLERCGAEGLETFDLGLGEGHYKEVWCETTEMMFDTIVPVSARGHAFALAEAARLSVKRQVKQNPFLWSLALKLRSLSARS